MTFKQTQYINGLLEGKTKMQSALDAGYSKSTAITASENIESAIVLRSLEQKMEDAGITPEYLVGKLKDGLEAINKYSRYNFDDVPDYAVRLKYLILALKIRSLL